MMSILPCFSAFKGRKKMLVLFTISLLLFTAGIAQPLSGTYTINAAATTGGTNFQSFNEAAYALSSGVSGPVTFNVNAASGPYNEQITFYPIPGSSATNTITFNGNGAVIQFTSTSSINRAGIKLDSADYITFDSLKITPITSGLVNYEYGYGFQLVRDADHNTIKRCTIINTNNITQPQNTEGIVIGSGDEEANNLGSNQCDSNLIANNTIIGGNSGITLFSFAGYTEPLVTIRGNQVLDNTIRNFREAGIYLFGNEGTLIKGNDIGGLLWNSYGSGINVSEMNKRVTITGNRIHNISKDTGVTSAASFDAIGVSYCRNLEGNAIVIANNLVYDIRTDGDQSGLQTDNSTNVYFLHNTVVLDTAGASSGATTYGFEYGTGDSSIQFKNNIIYITRGGSSGKRGIYMANAGINFSCDYNDYYINATSGSNIIGQLSTSYTSLTSWQSGTGKDYHSYTINPLFPSATSNLKPAAGSLDNTGIYVNISTDIDNVTRSNTGPDIGAYEFLSSPCSTPPVAGTVNAIPGLLLCAGSPIFLTATGNSGGIGQTYQWQTSTTETGTYTNLGTSSTTTPRDAVANTTLYYRLQATCGTAVAYSTPIQIRTNNTLVAGNYTINKTQATAGTNYNSFADVLIALKCGISGPVVFNVASGTGPYTEQVIIPAVTGSSTTNTITFNGNGETLNYLSTNGSERAVLKLNNTSNIIIDSLTITALADTSTQYGYGVQLINNADNNIIRRSTINVSTTSASNRFVGLAVSSATDAETTGTGNLCDNNTFSNNTINGGYWGVLVSSGTSAAAIINNNKFTGNTIKNFYGTGISITGTNNTLIEGNDISRPTRPAGTLTTTTYGIYVNGLSTSVKVSKNKIHNLFDLNPNGTNTVYGINTNSSDGTAAATNVYSNNAIYSLNGSGVHYGIYNTGSDYALYYHNTISLDGPSNTANAARGFYQTTTASGIQFRNNIVTITRGGTGINHGIYINTTGTTYTSDNNDFYVASTTGTNYTGAISTTNYATLVNWQTGTSKDANSKNINPAYTSLSSGNLKPTAVLLNDKGTFVNITTDILDINRSATTPDIGAWEFDDALPVKLVDINALRIASDVLISWSTATEINSANFIIERSIDGVNFAAAGTVAAAGNSTSSQRYSYTDKNVVNLAAGKVIYYRIKAVDKDGFFEYSKVVSVNLDGKSKVEVATFPNPFVNSLYVKIATPSTTKAIVTLMDMAGKKIATQQQALTIGSNVIAINNTPQLVSGSYIIKVEVDGDTYTTKVVK